MGIINWVAFGGVLIDLVIISVIISNSYWGYRRGLVGVLFKVLVFLLSLLIMVLLYKPVSNTIMEKTELDEWLSEKIAQNISGTTLEKGELLTYEQNTNISTGLIDILNSFITEALQKSASNVVGYVSSNLAVGMIRIGTMLGLLIVSRFFLFFIRFVAEFIANLPFIKIFNKTGGLVFGVIKGFLTVYVILAVFSIASPLISNWGVIDAVQDSTLGKKMYNDNIIIDVVLK